MSTAMFESDDELETFRRDVAELVTILNNDSASLRAKGFDVDGAIAELEGKLADLEKARAEEDQRTSPSSPSAEESGRTAKRELHQQYHLNASLYPDADRS